MVVDAFNRRFIDVNELHIGAIEALEVINLDTKALAANDCPGCQCVRGLRIIDAVAYALFDEISGQPVGVNIQDLVGEGTGKTEATMVPAPPVFFLALGIADLQR